jgi:hypothetical protein
LILASLEIEYGALSPEKTAFSSASLLAVILENRQEVERETVRYRCIIPDNSTPRIPLFCTLNLKAARFDPTVFSLWESENGLPLALL